MATPLEELQDLVSRAEKAAKEYNMIIIAAKMKFMTNINKTLEVLVDGGKLEQVDSFGYLGSRITHCTDCEREVNTRLAIGMAAMFKLIKIWKYKAISTNMKLRVLKVLVCQ